MKWSIKCVLLALTLINVVGAAAVNVKEELAAMAEQIQILKTLHLTDVTRLRREVEELKEKASAHDVNNHERNEQQMLQWAKSSMHELRVEVKELGSTFNNSVILRQMHIMQNDLERALAECAELVELGRAQEARLDALDGEAGRLRRENHQLRTTLADHTATLATISKEVKIKQSNDLNGDYNDLVEPREGLEVEGRHHKLRHNKMMHAQVSRLARAQGQLDEHQQSLQAQVLDIQRRIDHFEEPNWNLLSAKVDFLELEHKVMQHEIKNATQKVSDLDKLHASMLELREDLEGVENKADKTVPEFRKEISKLDINFAQLNAQSLYLKEDQENLRQSVKAIAVSVSNSIDRAEMDRLLTRKLNESVSELQTRSKQHFYRLNDHILKSEANNNGMNKSEMFSLPELMGEVKELQPVQREYENLVSQLPRDCSGVAGPAGVYLIHPGRQPFDTWCSNGSTLLQRRYNGSVEFNRKFAQYVHGFGNPESEYWLGLDSMHRLTADNCSAMRIDMTDIYGAAWYAEYEHFSVGSADSGYVLEVSGFKGNASDAFDYQNHMEFSTIDRDRDISNTHCAANYEGGWWFSHCQHVNINGKYTLGLTWFDGSRNEWIAVATTEMRLYRRPECY